MNWLDFLFVNREGKRLELFWNMLHVIIYNVCLEDWNIQKLWLQEWNDVYSVPHSYLS